MTDQFEPRSWFGWLLRRSALVALAGFTQLHAAEVLTLEQAISTALDQNRSVQSSVLDGRKAQEELAVTRTRQFPGLSTYMLGSQQLRSFDFTLEKGVLGTYDSTGPLPDSDVHLKTPRAMTGLMTIQAKQPLSTLIRIHRNMDTQKTGIELAKEQTRAERQKVARDVKGVYYSLQQVESSLRSVRETMNLYREVEKLTSNYVLQEVALRGDLLDARTRLAKTLQTEVQLRNQQYSAKEQLNQLLGRDISTDFDVQPVLEATGYEANLEEARARAIRDRPEIRQTELRHKQAEQDLRAKRAEYIPDISAEFNNLTFMNWGRFMPTQSTSVGVSLSWEPFDWGRRKHEIAGKQLTIDQARLSQKETEGLVLADVNDKFRQLRYRQAELRVARLSQETTTENLRVMKNKYSVQAALVKDVLQAQVSLEQSNTDYQQALTSFWNARADYERALGEDQ